MCLAVSRDLRAGTFPGTQRFHSWGSFLWGATLLKARAWSMWNQEEQETMQMYEASEAVCCWVAQSFSLISPLQIMHALQVSGAQWSNNLTREMVRTWSAERHFVPRFVSCVHSTRTTKEFGIFQAFDDLFAFQVKTGFVVSTLLVLIFMKRFNCGLSLNKSNIADCWTPSQRCWTWRGGALRYGGLWWPTVGCCWKSWVCRS